MPVARGSRGGEHVNIDVTPTPVVPEHGFWKGN